LVNEDRPLLALEHVTAGYGPVVAVRDVSLEVRPGEIVALLGANGAGKSTTLMTISGLVRASAGSVIFDGREVQRLRPEEIVRRGIAMAPEGRRIFAHLTVTENLRLGAAIRRDKDAIATDMDDQFSLFPVLRQRQKQLAGTLSGGEQQMLALARALMSRPKLMLLDEPSLGLAPRVVAQIFELLAELPKNGMTILLVEQNVRLALEVASRGYVLASGELQVAGSSDELRTAVDIEEVYLGSSTEGG
jgi:branched-chain amino acid transport system ATP-binding protein